MPIYEYLCEKCGSELEVAQKITDTPLTMHAECGGKIKRLISTSTFHLKGSGWYATDYASGAAKKSACADKAPCAATAPAPAAAPSSTDKII